MGKREYMYVYVVEEIFDEDLAKKMGMYVGQVLFWNYRGKLYTITLLDAETGKISALARIRLVGKCLEGEDKIECAKRLGVYSQKQGQGES